MLLVSSDFDHFIRSMMIFLFGSSFSIIGVVVSVCFADLLLRLTVPRFCVPCGRFPDV